RGARDSGDDRSFPRIGELLGYPDLPGPALDNREGWRVPAGLAGTRRGAGVGRGTRHGGEPVDGDAGGLGRLRGPSPPVPAVGPRHRLWTDIEASVADSFARPRRHAGHARL